MQELLLSAATTIRHLPFLHGLQCQSPRDTADGPGNEVGFPVVPTAFSANIKGKGPGNEVGWLVPQQSLVCTVVLMSFCFVFIYTCKYYICCIEIPPLS